MASVKWTGGSHNELWGSAGNWSGGAVPGSSDSVTLGLTGTETVTLNLDVDISSLLLSTGGTVDLAGFTLQTAAGVTLADGADIAGHGALDIGGHLNGTGTILASGGTLVLDVNGTVASSIGVSIGSGADLKIEGHPELEGNSILVGNGEELEIATGALLTLGAAEITTGGTIQLDGASLKDTAGLKLGGILSGSGTVTTGTTSASELRGGTVIAEGGNLVFTDAVDQQGPATKFDISNAATLTFDDAVGTNGFNNIVPDVTFESQAGVLDLANAPANSFHGALTDFLSGDKIIVAGANDTVTQIDPDVIEIQHGKTVEAIINLGPSSVAYDVTSSGGVTTITAICFMAGTRIRTPDGETQVEKLRRGDLVLTQEGQARPIAWLGRQTVSTVFADPLRVWPIRIKAGAITDNVPSRDLVLSPGHAIRIDDILVLAGALVNGTSIVRERSVPERFTYYHIELDQHALIMAENTPAETFVDNVDRLSFDNWQEHEALFPDGHAIAELPLPVAKSHRQVPTVIRSRLAARAALISTPVENAVA
jgi:hypothetical protein